MTWEGLTPPYRTIVADPPWHYEGFARGDSPSSPEVTEWGLPYSGLSVPDICALPVAALAARDSRVFLWTTNRYLPESFAVVSAWGFGYVQLLIWEKGNASPFGGSVAPNSAEFVLVAKKGNPPVAGRWASSVFQATRGHIHSQKPGLFLDLVEHVSPGPYVELFARQPRLGWDAWGWGVETPKVAL